MDRVVPECPEGVTVPKTVDPIRVMVKDVWSGPLLAIDDDGADRYETVDSDPGSDFRAERSVNDATVWIVRYNSRSEYLMLTIYFNH